MNEGHGIDGDDTIRVLIADDHPVFRYGMSALLGSAADTEVVVTARLATPHRHQPHPRCPSCRAVPLPTLPAP